MFLVFSCLGRRNGAQRISQRQRFLSGELCAYSMAPTEEVEAKPKVHVSTWQTTFWWRHFRHKTATLTIESICCPAVEIGMAFLNECPVILAIPLVQVFFVVPRWPKYTYIHIIYFTQIFSCLIDFDISQFLRLFWIAQMYEQGQHLRSFRNTFDLCVWDKSEKVYCARWSRKRRD